MKASKVFLFPSRFEGWGLAVGEALACGLPVVCYDLPALREIFGGCKSVFFVASKDTADLARSCENILFRDDLKKLRIISEEYVRRFDWTDVAAADLQFIENFLGTP
jgi:glycosyltransferase involved in cell wall biosynthesis